MKNVMLCVLFFITAGLCYAQQVNTSGDFNLGFEQKTGSGKFPDHWFQWGTGYKITLDEETKNSGKVAALIEPLGVKSPNTFGCIATGIPATYDAKEIELRAYMKFSNVAEGPIGLMIRMDGESGIVGFENMQGRNIQGTKDWTQFSVKIPYPENSNTIYIGAILSGTGKLWVDDMEILLDGKNIAEAKVKIPKQYKADTDNGFADGSGIHAFSLNNQKADDLQLLGQIWGFLKYYHPSIAAGDFNWDNELFRILPKVIGSANRSERNMILANWVKRLGVNWPEGNSPVKDPIKLQPDFSWINDVEMGKDLSAALHEVRNSDRPKTNYYIAMAPGIGNPEFKNEKPYTSMTPDDVGIRLLSLYRYWNMINYFFPYRNLIDENWNDVLKQYIPRFVEADDELKYKLTVLSLIARIHDTHGNIWGGDNTLNNYKGQRFAALEISFVENKAVVTNYFDKALGERSGIKIGDVIETVDGMPVSEIVKRKLDHTPASNYPTKLRDIARDLLRSNSATLNVQVSNVSGNKSATIETFGTNEIDLYAKFNRRDTCFRKINAEIAYVYPGTLRNEVLPAVMEEVKKTKGLIIDFRCYPSDFIVFTLGEYLLPAPAEFVKFSNGSVTTPGLFTFTKPLSVGRKNSEYYKGKVVIIVNETTQSSAEYQTMGLSKAPKATVLGSTTAAADGNVSKIILPGGVQTMISGIGVYYPDGKETQRIGIVPDIEVKPTIKGIREGRDELLEKAISIATYVDK